MLSPVYFMIHNVSVMDFKYFRFSFNSCFSFEHLNYLFSLIEETAIVGSVLSRFIYMNLKVFNFLKMIK